MILTEKEKLFLDEKYGLNRDAFYNPLLDRTMQILRNKRRFLEPENSYSTFIVGDLLQIWIQTPACRFSRKGSCTICNYWMGRKIPDLMEQVFRSVRVLPQIRRILINTCGSCLDPAELSEDEQNRLLDWLNHQSAPIVILETHIHTLTEETVRRVCEKLSGKEIFFEVGQESVEEDVLYYCYNKPSVNCDRSLIVKRIHDHGAKCIANIILGAPFLLREEQIRDAFEGIITLLNDDIDYITLFPINVKPNTLPEFLYKKGMYQVVDGNMLVDVLYQLPDEFLDRVDVAWFGEHEEEGTVQPYVPAEHRQSFIEEIKRYNHSNENAERRKILDVLFQNRERWGNRAAEEGEVFIGLVGRLDKAYNLLYRQLVLPEMSDATEASRGAQDGNT